MDIIIQSTGCPTMNKKTSKNLRTKAGILALAALSIFGKGNAANKNSSADKDSTKTNSTETSFTPSSETGKKAYNVTSKELSDKKDSVIWTASIEPISLIKKDSITGKAWPSPELLMKNLQLSKGSKLGTNDTRIYFDNVFITTYDDLIRNYAMYETDGFSKNIKFLIPQLDSVSDLYKNRRGRYEEFSAVTEAIDKIRNGTAATYSHEYHHIKNSLISKFGLSIAELERFELEDELSSFAANLIFRREVLLASGDIKDALTGTKITELPYTAPVEGAYQQAVVVGKKTVDLNKEAQPIRYANWLFKNKKKIIANKQISPEEANVIIQTTLDMFDDALLDVYIAGISRNTVISVRKIFGIYNYVKGAPENFNTLQNDKPGNNSMIFDKASTIDSVSNTMWSFYTSDGKIVNLWAMLSDKDRANIQKRIGNILQNKKLAEVVKLLGTTYADFDKMAADYYQKIQGLNRSKPVYQTSELGVKER